jgi:oxidase EvaA
LVTIENELFNSWLCQNGIVDDSAILDLINKKNKELKVRISKCNLLEMNGWVFENGVIHHKDNSFFKIVGIKSKSVLVKNEQPIIIQNEIGFLGFICKKFNGVLHFLVQAKIEPGNVNKIQLSPTIQATKSNFEQKHGGRKPLYLDFFLNANKYQIIVDQIQSEQASRFYKKRNRNIVVDIGDEDIEASPSHIWMTLGQIKHFMQIPNLVNMDTRTVLSCLPYSIYQFDSEFGKFKNQFLFNSIVNKDSPDLPSAFHKINDYKMFNYYEDSFCGLDSLKRWGFENGEFVCKDKANFKVIFCKLEIEGREVRSWCQPLFEATGNALFALFAAKFGNKYKFLVRLKHEVGTFDLVEYGPTIQKEFNDVSSMPIDTIDSVLLQHLNGKKGILNDVILSEEGGRFYHEQNRNIVIEIDKDEIPAIPDDAIWLDYKTLNYLVQSNNVLNIQLRNLLSLLEDK